MWFQARRDVQFSGPGATHDKPSELLVYGHAALLAGGPWFALRLLRFYFLFCGVVFGAFKLVLIPLLCFGLRFVLCCVCVCVCERERERERERECVLRSACMGNEDVWK